MRGPRVLPRDLSTLDMLRCTRANAPTKRCYTLRLLKSICKIQPRGFMRVWVYLQHKRVTHAYESRKRDKGLPLFRILYCVCWGSFNSPYCQVEKVLKFVIILNELRSLCKVSSICKVCNNNIIKNIIEFIKFLFLFLLDLTMILFGKF